MNCPYLIESAPNYRRYLVAKCVREAVDFMLLPLTAAVATVSGYRDELNLMLSAPLEPAP